MGSGPTVGHVIGRTGQHSARTRARVLRPAEKLAQRLAAAGDRRGEQIIRDLIRSHGAQRVALVRFYRDLQAAWHRQRP